MSKAIAKTATIASGQTTSDVVDTLGLAIAGIKFPAALVQQFLYSLVLMAQTFMM